MQHKGTDLGAGTIVTAARVSTGASSKRLLAREAVRTYPPCYEKSGTHIAYRSTRLLCRVRVWRCQAERAERGVTTDSTVWSPIRLGACYAMSGTGIAYSPLSVYGRTMRCAEY
eukprot:2895698-Rhodomonas_salina.2